MCVCVCVCDIKGKGADVLIIIIIAWLWNNPDTRATPTACGEVLGGQFFNGNVEEVFLLVGGDAAGSLYLMLYHQLDHTPYDIISIIQCLHT